MFPYSFATLKRVIELFCSSWSHNEIGRELCGYASISHIVPLSFSSPISRFLSMTYFRLTPRGERASRQFDLRHPSESGFIFKSGSSDHLPPHRYRKCLEEEECNAWSGSCGGGCPASRNLARVYFFYPMPDGDGSLAQEMCALVQATSYRE